MYFQMIDCHDLESIIIDGQEYIYFLLSELPGAVVNSAVANLSDALHFIQAWSILIKVI